MSDPLFDASDGNTPVGDDDAEGLRLSWVRTRGDDRVRGLRACGVA